MEAYNTALMVIEQLKQPAADDAGDDKVIMVTNCGNMWYPTVLYKHLRYPFFLIQLKCNPAHPVFSPG